MTVDKVGPNNPRHSFDIPDLAGNVAQLLNNVPDRTRRMSTAWLHLIETIAVEGVINKALATEAELSRTRWNGCLVKTGLELEEADGNGHQLSPSTLGNVNVIINGAHLPHLDIPLDIAQQGRDRITLLTQWRSSPRCYMARSAMYLGLGDNHTHNYPCPADWVDNIPQYQLTESHEVNRVLIARDIFKHSDSIHKYRFRSTSSLMVFVSETASLIGGVANWIYNYYGMSLTVVNQLYPMERNVPYPQHEIMVRATNALAIPFYGSPWRPYTGGDLLALIRAVNNMPDFSYTRWNSLPLPWWFAEAVATKFGITFAVTKQPKDVCIDDVLDDGNDDDR